ncbi:WGR domain-containing protein [Candidatus Acetothermia bacterium]|nr:WGR domain-containing protein [Candidatus Acetothermia bacterium]
MPVFKRSDVARTSKREGTLAVWHSIDPSKNRFRFYSLSIEPDLWNQPCLIQRWGRLHTRGKRKFVWLPSDEMRKLIQKVARQRELHGYERVQ